MPRKLSKSMKHSYFMLKNFLIVLIYLVFYVLILDLSKFYRIGFISISHQIPHFEEMKFLQAYFPIIFEILLVFGIYCLFKEFWKDNKKEIVWVWIFYTIIAIPLFLHVYFPGTKVEFLIFQLIAGCLVIFLFNSLFYLRNIGISENSEKIIQISRNKLELYFKKLNLTRDQIVLMKFQWFSSNLIWFIGSFFSIFLFIAYVDTPYIGIGLLFLINVMFSYLFGLFQQKSMGIKIIFLFLLGLIHGMLCFFLIELSYNFGNICEFFVGTYSSEGSRDMISWLILFFINALLSFFNFVINHQFFVQVIKDSPKYQPRLFKIMIESPKGPKRLKEKFWYKIPGILVISLILSFIWGTCTVMLGEGFPNYTPELLGMVINSISGNYLLLYANPGRHLDQSKKKVLLKVFLLSGLFFGLNMLYYLLRINQIVNTVFLITVQYTLTFTYLIVTRINYQKVKIHTANCSITSN